jgi:hypothetical protein
LQAAQNQIDLIYGAPDSSLHRAWSLNTKLQNLVTQLTSERDAAQKQLFYTVQERDALQEQVKTMTLGFQDALGKLSAGNEGATEEQKQLASSIGKLLLQCLAPAQEEDPIQNITLAVFHEETPLYSETFALSASQEAQLRALCDEWNASDAPLRITLEP